MRVGLIATVSAAALVAGIGLAAAKSPARPTTAPWVTSWATALMISDGANLLPPEQLSHATLRQSVRLSVGGKAYRLALSNLFGNAPLHLSGVHVATALSQGAIVPASDRALTFSGKADVTIPAGATYLSDPVAMPVGPLADLAISILYDTAPAVETGHPGSRATSYVVAGDHLSDPQLAGAVPVDHWYQIAAIEVLATPPAGGIVALGDSITDGRGSTTNGNDRWTNILAAALQATPAGKGRAVLNAGIGGNCVLTTCLGPSALARFDRDVLAPSGVDTLVVYEGVNDLGGLTREHSATPEEHASLVARLIQGFEQMAAKAKAHGLKTYIATILPYGSNAYYHPNAANEADRAAVNGWIRSQTQFAGVIDFDLALRDPSHPEKLNPAYDSGDGLHASVAGYQVMGTLTAKVLSTGHAMKPGKRK